jgi:hypothetical protein
MLFTDGFSTRLIVQEQRSLAGSLIGVGCGRWAVLLCRMKRGVTKTRGGRKWFDVGGSESPLGISRSNLFRTWIVEALLILCSWELLVTQRFDIRQRVRK